MIEVIDRVRFVMPRDLELQFPAMATVQAWVGVYQHKMAHNDTSMGKATWKLEYQLDMPDEDLQFFRKAGLVLTQEPVQLQSQVDMLIDMSDENLLKFKEFDKHALQACAILSGLPVTIAPFPRLRFVKPSLKNVWMEVSGNCCNDPNGELFKYKFERLLDIQDYEITGVYGLAGRWTFLAAAMGLAVIEILPRDRSRRWLSKYASGLYRSIECVNYLVNGGYQRYTNSEIERAQASISRYLLLGAQKAKEQEEK